MATQADDFRRALSERHLGTLIAWTGPVADADGERARPIGEVQLALTHPDSTFDSVNEVMSRYGDLDPNREVGVAFDWNGPGLDSWAVDAKASPSESFESIMMTFSDGSTHQLIDDLSRYADDGEPLDVGVKLLEPVTIEELRGVERILSVLEDAITNGTLSDFQERRILTIAEMIREARNDADADTTERWKLIGPIRTGLRYVIKDVPKDVLAWWKLSEILTEINWTELAGSLPL